MYCEKTTILIQSLQLQARVGVSLEEREKRQTIEVDLATELMSAHIPKDEIGCTVSYSEVVKDLRALVDERAFVLLETMAEEMAKACFRYPLVERVKIQIRKPNKLPACAAVGVERVFSR